MDRYTSLFNIGYSIFIISLFHSEQPAPTTRFFEKVAWFSCVINNVGRFIVFSQ